MLDIQLLRKDLDGVARRLARRGYTLQSNIFIRLEAERHEIQRQTEALRERRNSLSKRIGALKREQRDTSAAMAEASAIGADLQAFAARLEAVQLQLSELLFGIPNLPHDSVPIGCDATQNIEISRWGAPRRFAFEIKDHVDIGAPLGLDFETAAKISGARFAVLRGPLARLARSLAQFMLDIHTGEHGYTEVQVPYIVNAAVMRGTGQLPKLEDDLFKVLRKTGEANTPENFYLIPTAEVPVTNLVRESILNADELPLKFVAYTPCFRSEAGSYGKDTRGMIRQHQFDKVELVRIVLPEQSYQALEALVGDAEAILQKLELPYRKVLLCSGDLGFSSAKTYDLEVWLPAQKTYREISSCSNMEAFQARRMQARFRNPQNKPEFVHTLNGSGLAIGRTLVAILENFQNEDGTVTVPAALRPYLGGTERIAPAAGR